MKLVLLATLLAFACSKKSERERRAAVSPGGSAAVIPGGAIPPGAPPTKAGGDCSRITAAVDAMAGNAAGTGVTAEVRGKLEAIMLARCSEDAWPPGVIDCFATAAKDMTGMRKCAADLPLLVGEKLNAEIRDVMAAGSAAAPGSAATK